MLIIALIIAFVLYATLAIFYETAVPHLDKPPTFLVALRDAIFSAPSSLPLAILKWGLIMFAFYLVGDAIIAFAKSTRKK